MLKKFIIIFISFICILNVNAEELRTSVTNNINKDLTNSLNEHFTSGLGKFFPTAEVTLSSGKTQKVKGNVLVVSPLSDINDTKNVTFTQGSIYLSNDTETFNLGVGQRKLLDNENLMLGANLFYDNELGSNHRRASFGIEAITSVGSLRANQYYGISGWKLVGNINEKALDGNDIEVGAPLPYLPWANFYLRTFEWEGASGAADLKGDEMSLEAKLPFGLNVEVGKRSNDGNTKDRKFLNLTWTCCNKEEPNFGISDKAYTLTSVADQRFQKVRRQNLIVKQQELALSVIGF